MMFETIKEFEDYIFSIETEEQFQNARYDEVFRFLMKIGIIRLLVAIDSFYKPPFLIVKNLGLYTNKKDV